MSFTLSVGRITMSVISWSARITVSLAELMLRFILFRYLHCKLGTIIFFWLCVCTLSCLETVGVGTLWQQLHFLWVVYCCENSTHTCFTYSMGRGKNNKEHDLYMPRTSEQCTAYQSPEHTTTAAGARKRWSTRDRSFLFESSYTVQVSTCFMKPEQWFNQVLTLSSRPLMVFLLFLQYFHFKRFLVLHFRWMWGLTKKIKGHFLTSQSDFNYKLDSEIWN